MGHPLNAEEDNVNLEKCSHLLGYIDSSNLIEMHTALCGGMGTEANCRIYVNPKTVRPIQEDDFSDQIWSHDGDLVGNRTFYFSLIHGYDRLVFQSAHENDPIQSTNMTVREFSVHNTEDPDEEIKIEVLDRLQYLDKPTVPPYQGIAAIEKPLGEDGPRVKVLDPLSLTIVKSCVTQQMDKIVETTGNAGWKSHCQEKSKKYKWHLRRLAMTIPTYLEVAQERYLKGEIPNDPAIIARKLLLESYYKDNLYFSILGEKPTQVLRDACRKCSGDNLRAHYTAEDFKEPGN